MKEKLPEPWLRGPIAGVHPLVAPVLFSFAQVREDLAMHAASLTREQIWRRVGGTSVGFHLKHLAGSVDRLTTYLSGGELSPVQLAYLAAEQQPGAELTDLLRNVEQALASAEAHLMRLDPATLFDTRTVGRRALPSTVLGLLVHLAEHTQRHLGQIITLSQVIRQSA